MSRKKRGEERAGITIEREKAMAGMEDRTNIIISVALKEGEPDSFYEMRKQYLDSLSEAQELYLEQLVRKSRFFRISCMGQRAGYVAIYDRIMTEYYVVPDFLPYNEMLFAGIISQERVDSFLVKSFDPLLLKSCIGESLQPRIVGHLFRNRYQGSMAPVFLGAGLQMRPAVPEDLRRIRPWREGLFASDDELEQYITAGEVLLFFQNGNPRDTGNDGKADSSDREGDTEADEVDEGILVGAGLLHRTIPDRPDVDIGMLVRPEYRRQGIGSAIIGFMAEYCQNRGWYPVCGCAAENKASRRSLEKAGFRTMHALLECRVAHE